MRRRALILTAGDVISPDSHSLLGRYLRRVTCTIFLSVVSLMLWESPAVAVDTASWEAESMTFGSFASVVNASGASGGKALKYTANGVARKYVTTTQPSDTLTFRIKGHRTSSGRPQFYVKVNGNEILRKAYEGDVWKTESVIVSLPAGTH